MKLLLSCEHAGNYIPEAYKAYFDAAETELNSHRGYDLGALDLFLFLKNIADYELYAEESRLLVELNRSLHHPNLFSEFTKRLASEEKQQIIKNYYLPYRNQIENQILKWIEAGEEVLHFSVHSFTPELNGELRNADIGILYDPARDNEKHFSKKFQQNLQELVPDFKIRFNYPYLGKADGLSTSLRKKFPKGYLGIEFELNQKYVSENKIDFTLKQKIEKALEQSFVS